MLRFIHTADLQIGMTSPGVGTLAQRVQEARIDALARVLAHARERDAQCIVIAGDLFEHNRVQRDLVARVAELLRTAAQPVLIVAGNHDYYGADSVYRREEFRNAGSHVHVFPDRSPVVFRELDTTIYPCPCFETRSPVSPVAWITRQSGTTYHVCIAHGNIPERIAGGDHDYPMRDDDLRRLGMDYVALGHWHSVHPDPDLYPDSPWFYSGTPEPTKFGEACSGFALLVELSNGTRRVSKLPTGRYIYRHIDYTITGSEDVAALRRDTETLLGDDNLLLKLVLSGVVSVDVRERLDRFVEELSRKAAFLTVRDDGLTLVPTEEDVRRLPADGMTGRLLHRLRAQHDSAGDDERARYSRAIALVYTLVRARS